MTESRSFDPVFIVYGERANALLDAFHKLETRLDDARKIGVGEAEVIELIRPAVFATASTVYAGGG